MLEAVEYTLLRINGFSNKELLELDKQILPSYMHPINLHNPYWQKRIAEKKQIPKQKVG